MPTSRISAKNYHKNPRRITPVQMTRLGNTLAELGDLSGIVVDEQSREIIGGNQRAKAIDLAQCDVEIIQQFDPPTSQGTTALGFIVWQGERYAYRQVRWTPEQCARANIVANAAGGDWDWDILRESFDPALLANAGLDADALAAMQTDAAELAKMVEMQAAPPLEEAADDETIIDRAEELQKKWQCAKGDIWTAAGHFWFAMIAATRKHGRGC